MCLQSNGVAKECPKAKEWAVLCEAACESLGAYLRKLVQDYDKGKRYGSNYANGNGFRRVTG